VRCCGVFAWLTERLPTDLSFFLPSFCRCAQEVELELRISTATHLEQLLLAALISRTELHTAPMRSARARAATIDSRHRRAARTTLPALTRTSFRYGARRALAMLLLLTHA
jgi:hypothetical protein